MIADRVIGVTHDATGPYGWPGTYDPPMRKGERGSGGLVGGGPSQLGADGAMRARDVSRPAEPDLEAAESSVEISYRPPARRPGNGQGAGPGGSSPDAS
jgi:hypothetical protein